MATTSDNDCRICGWTGMRARHAGAVDCINAYRAYTDELRALLPQGKQVLCASLSRDSMARLWIEGEITYESLERLLTFIRFMQEAWTSDIVAEKKIAEPVE